ncbi:phosphorylase [Agrobacterium tumefaciens]
MNTRTITDGALDGAAKSSNYEAYLAVGQAKLEIYKKIKFALINAIPHEYAATQAVFGESEKIPSAFRKQTLRYVTLQDAGGDDMYVALAGTSGAGIAQAATATAQIHVACPFVKKVILIGIAAGQPNMIDKEKDVRLGDIVVGDKLVQYDHIKRTDGVCELRGDNIQPADRQLLQAVDRLRSKQVLRSSVANKKPWSAHIEKGCSEVENAARPDRTKDPKSESRNYEKGHTYSRPDDDPYVHVGTIGSANILLKDAEFRDALNERNGIIAFEMEGAGVAIAAANFDLGYLNVRGICDYGDNEKNDDWQRYASVCAASFARAVLEEG